MGVTIQLGGVNNWLDYLDKEVENNNIDDDDREEYERRFDGYQMQWAFDTTAIIHTAEDAIDAACISSRYADGGFCVGIQFKGTSVRSPKLWAVWVY